MLIKQETMILILDDYCEGGRSTIFFDRKRNLVFKVYKSYRHPLHAYKSECCNEEAFNEWMRNIYLSERAALELVARSSISHFFPHCHTGHTIEKIKDKNDFDITDQYLTDSVLALDIIEGTNFRQHAPVVRTYCLSHGIELDKIFSDLRNMGINSYDECSVYFIRHSNIRIRITNIATSKISELQPHSLKGSEIGDKNQA
jgi:hypothetical protein